MRPEDVNARQVQQAFADGATLDGLEKPIAFLRSPGAPGDAHPVISFNDDDDHKPWKTDQPTREGDTQTVTLGAAKLQVTPMACRHLRGAAMHFDTGLLWVDVEDDFSRARRRQVIARLAGWLRRRPDADRILSFDEVVAALGWRGEHYLGLQTIRLDTVAGTVDSRRDFDRRFRPTSNRVRQRWERLDLAQRRGVSLPPIDVYRVGDLHFVMDGHHRVSVAIAAGQKTIEAYVTEVLTRIPATGISRRGGLPLKAAGIGGAIPGREDTGDREPADRADAL